ncbi:MAG TPA: choice-of-anchor D domain-containing protein [Candidatus Saccharimonadales bacterium]|nr:choice-of-anchor D domain-containing protein [Candidatus Saccharimonadales bacterium]
MRGHRPSRLVACAALIGALAIPLACGKSRTTTPPNPPAAPACSLSVAELDFDTVDVGQYANRTFTITNTGGDTLTGSVTAGCAGYSLVGPASYRLAAGQSETITVRCAPLAGGSLPCSLRVGSGGCGAVRCAATARVPPACRVQPTYLDFGTVLVGEWADRDFTITNTGGGVLNGTVSAPCTTFSVSGALDYSLAAGQSQSFTVRFTPKPGAAPQPAPGRPGPRPAGGGAASSPLYQACTVSTGCRACYDVVCKGNIPQTRCWVSVDTLKFGPVQVGSLMDRSFVIRNVAADGILLGTASLGADCTAFSFVGSPSYGLAPGEAGFIVVRFTSTRVGDAECTVYTGATGCGPVVCTATGEASGAPK